MTFKAEIQASLGWNWNDGALDNDRLNYGQQLAGGNADNQAEAVWHAVDQALAADGSTTLDLAALERTVLGRAHTVALAAVKAILVINQDDNGGTLLLGGAATGAWSGPLGDARGPLSVPPGSPLLLANRKTGWPVDAAHHHLLLTASGGDVHYSIVVLGTTTPPAAS